MTRTRARNRGILAGTLVLGLLLSIVSAAGGSRAAPSDAVVIEFAGPIGPATSDYLQRALEKAQDRGASVVILRMDTPGGLSTSMREIIQNVLSSPVAVVTYVAPSGARAASAGTYILYASHVAAMAPGTNLGAATPVAIGGLPSPAPRPEEDGKERNGEKDEKGDEETGQDEGERPRPSDPRPTLADKAVNDAAAYIRSLAQLRGRNADWAEKAVTEAASLSAEEALEAGVIDLIAGDIDDLLAKLDGRTVALLGERVELETAEAGVSVIEPDWRTELLAVITNPNIAYILMLMGIYGLIFEFTHPGAILPGVVGAISLFLALFAFHVLPINFAGLGLIGLGIAFMVAEAFMPAFGALGIGGLIAFVIGSVILFDVDVPGYGVSRSLIFSIATLSGGAFALVLAMAVKARRRPVVSGQERMIGSHGRVADWGDGRGRVLVQGELWQATASRPLEPGKRVRVAAMERLTLIVEPVEDKGEG